MRIYNAEDNEGKQKCFSLSFPRLLFKKFALLFSVVPKWRKAHKDFPILKGPKSDNLRAKNRLVNDYTAFPINDNAIADVQGEGPKVEVLSYFNHFAGIKMILLSKNEDSTYMSHTIRELYFQKYKIWCEIDCVMLHKDGEKLVPMNICFVKSRPGQAKQMDQTLRMIQLCG